MASESSKSADAAAPAAAANAAEQKPETTTKPALGEDDEFEDFPVDGAFLINTKACHSQAEC